MAARRKAPRIKIKRVDEPPTADDGTRILVDRLWPRGMKKTALALDACDEDGGAEPGAAHLVGDGLKGIDRVAPVCYDPR